MIFPLYGPKGAKNHAGVWLPDDETHLVEMLSPGSKRYAQMPDGRPAYQRHKYLAAVAVLPSHRRNVFVDIGGHCGLWGMQAEADFGLVVAFEPCARHAEIYPWNMRTTGYVLNQCALGATAGAARVVNRTVGSSGDTHIEIDPSGDVPVACLDDFDLEPDMIKIDTEGGELAVVEGGMATIRRAALVVIEQKGHDARLGQGRHAALERLLDAGMIEARPPISGDHFMKWPGG